MEKIENEKIYKIILAILIAISISIIALFCIFIIGLSKVQAKSYFWNEPLVHNICSNNTLGYCSDYNVPFSRVLDPGYGVGNYYNVTYEAQYSNNSNGETTFEPGTYQVSFSGAIRLIDSASISTDKFKIRLLYYPNSSNNYGIATCDNNEHFNISRSSNTDNLYYYSYSCESLLITENKTFLGWNIYLDVPPLVIVKYIEYAQIDGNLQLIGEGDATNSDIINNQNQNSQNIINNNNANTDKVIDAIEGEGLEDTTPVNPNKKNELEKIEEGLLDKNITTSLNDIDISIDTNSNEFIWNLVTRIINTNSLIFGLVLTMLSLGVLKLVLNR